jgi:hypothetical protein
MPARRLATFAIAALLLAACGDDDFENRPRAAVALDLAGVIQDDRVTVSPSRRLGAGPFSFTISNQTDDPHTITIEGKSVRQLVGSVEPSDTLTFNQTLEPGSYEVRAGSRRAVRREIQPAVLKIGPPRKDSNSDLMLP